MKAQETLLIAALSLCSVSVLAQGKKDGGAPGPCKEIADICRQAGFTKGDWKKGDGLWKDCVDPIMQGRPSPRGATKPLPSVDGQLVAACKAKHPKYGGGK